MTNHVNPHPSRTAIYIDGFNLYFGLKSKGWQKYYWLDLWEFSTRLADKRKLVSVKYFTSDISGPQDKVSRQQAFLNAIRVHSPSVQIIKGKYLTKAVQCRKCSTVYDTQQEKMTDVNIASHVINDAWKDIFDVAIIISGDSDLVPPIHMVNREFPSKKVVVGFPPKRTSKEIVSTTQYFYVNESCFKHSQMTDTIIKPDGTFITKPPSWF